MLQGLRKLEYAVLCRGQPITKYNPVAHNIRLHVHCHTCPYLNAQVSEYASWSTGYYGRMINAALAAVGAPPNLVQFVTGYGEAGNALVCGGVDKLIFVGSTVVGKKVRGVKEPMMKAYEWIEYRSGPKCW